MLNVSQTDENITIVFSPDPSPLESHTTLAFSVSKVFPNLDEIVAEDDLAAEFISTSLEHNLNMLLIYIAAVQSNSQELRTLLEVHNEVSINAAKAQLGFLMKGVEAVNA